MTTILVKHEWGTQEDQAAQKFFTDMVQASKAGKLPGGFSLVSAHIDKSAKAAFCVWNAPSLQAFAEVAKKLNPPTKFQPYVVEKLA
ncbi:MAG: hypothetical protein QW767_02510 [Thermoprotei archaeon]